MKTAFLFPGQGAQKVGMGKDLYEAFAPARSVFDAAEDAARLPLKKLCFEGPQEELDRTDVAQPAILAVSAATLSVIREAAPALFKDDGPEFLAGLSLGEYTALYAAGAVGLLDAVRLVARRGELMQQAATAVKSAMVAVTGLDEDKARQLCEAAGDGEVLTCANFNCPGQIVLSGQTGACKRAEEMARDFGASGAVMLKVAGAFHSRIMQPAAEKFAETLEAVEFADPRAGVIANVDARPYESSSQIKPKLLAQLISPVRWQQSVEALLAGGVRQFYEIGPGRVLSGLLRRIDRDAKIVSVNCVRAVEKLAAQGD